jgi:phospholipase D1/2
MPAVAHADATIFRTGVNCWRIAHADRVAMLVDGETYFRALFDSICLAQRSILICGWDFHSRTQLLSDDEDSHGWSRELGELLNELTRKRRTLQVYVLGWDYPMIFGLDREWPSIIGTGWKPRRRVHLRYDNTHPVGGSHHQKLVVIDDSIAFCGGIDLTCKRWDTCSHSASDVRRAAGGVPYPPFHDMMYAVDGEAARALGELVRSRWLKATGEPVRSLPMAGRLWPSSVKPQITNARIAVSRTMPATESERGIHEVETLYLDMVNAAKRCIYIENQYFTANKVGDALAARLTEVDGPEVILVLRRLSHGWLEELTMQTLRTRLIQKLRAVDRFNRLRVFYPHIEGLQEGTCIDVHAKLMIVDEDWLRIGSANLANRSMGLDSECDLTVEAGGDARKRQAIQRFRAELLAEHLGQETDTVLDAIDQQGAVRWAIETLQGGERTLVSLEPLPEVSEAVLGVVGVADPEKPVAMQDLVGMLSGKEESGKDRGALWRALAVGALCITLAALWQVTPLKKFADPQWITHWAQDFGARWWAPIALTAIYVPASLVMFPRPLLTMLGVISFGPVIAFTCAMTGMLLSAYGTYLAGTQFDRRTVRKVAGKKLARIARVLRERGLVAITALRLVPIAPYAVEGIIAGAIRLRLRDFMLGTGIGIFPGVFAATLFGDQLHAALQDPAAMNYWLLAGVVLTLICATWGVRRWLIKAQREIAEGRAHAIAREHDGEQRVPAA